MLYRNFGSTGLQVSELTFGGGAVGGLLINADDETKQAVLQRALTAGINWIDTAPSYGQGKSEEALGKILPELDANPYISTKFTIDTNNPDLYGQIEESINGSLSRLNRTSVTLLQLHNPIGENSEGRQIGFRELLKPHGVFDILDGFRSQGMFAHIGITALGDVSAITRIIKSNRIASAQIYFNLLNPSAVRTPPPSWPCYNFTGLVDTCFEHDVATMNIRVFAAGVIATDARHGRERPLTSGDTVASETHKNQAVFSALGDSCGSRAQTAVRFALTQSRLSTIVIGLASMQHLDEALEAQSMGNLPDSATQAIQLVYSKFTG